MAAVTVPPGTSDGAHTVYGVTSPSGSTAAAGILVDGAPPPLPELTRRRLAVPGRQLRRPVLVVVVRARRRSSGTVYRSAMMVKASLDPMVVPSVSRNWQGVWARQQATMRVSMAMWQVAKVWCLPATT